MVRIVVGLAVAGMPAGAQTTAHVRVEENFRQTPNGTVLGQLDPGTPLNVVSRRGQWLEVDVEGWSWTRSYQRTDKAGFNVVLTAGGGENLRSAPSGDVLGHFERGALFNELDRQPGWLRVRRRGWIWAASVRRVATEPATASHGGSGKDTVSVRKPEGFTRVGSSGAAILNATGGDTIARTRPGAELQVVSREGSWARVRLEGWVWMPTGDSASAGEAVADSALTPAALKKDPEAYRGRVVAWKLQFISLERAEKVRTDFFEGEPYLLTRFGDSGGAFVYVAVSQDRLEEVQGLVPLEDILVTGRVRTGASALTGTPIVDLLKLERDQERK